MKVEVTEPKVLFKPVVITLETQEEVDKIFTIFNYDPITTFDPLYKKIYSKLVLYRKNEFISADEWDEFANAMTQEES